MGYSVVKYTLDGKFVATISGMGRNKGTWDHSHSKRTAHRHAASLRREDPNHLYKVEPSV
jgi:hypothetical protein